MKPRFLAWPWLGSPLNSPGWRKCTSSSWLLPPKLFQTHLQLKERKKNSLKTHLQLKERKKNNVWKPICNCKKERKKKQYLKTHLQLKERWKTKEKTMWIQNHLQQTERKQEKPMWIQNPIPTEMKKTHVWKPFATLRASKKTRKEGLWKKPRDTKAISSHTQEREQLYHNTHKHKRDSQHMREQRTHFDGIAICCCSSCFYSLSMAQHYNEGGLE